MDGASLFCKVRGKGPVLLILQGGDGDADAANNMVDHLVNNFTVVTYDRRGLSRSRIEGAVEGLRLPTHSGDAGAVLQAVTSEPALVFGTSIGAMIGLDLISRFPEKVRTLICHEPPAPQLLGAEEGARAAQQQEDAEQGYREEGIPGTMKQFVKMAGLNSQDHEPGVEPPRPGPERIPNLKFFLENDAPAVRLYRIDMAAVKASAQKIVVAAGSTSGALFSHQCALALAKELDTAIKIFPGGHNSFATHPRGVAEKLSAVLSVRIG